MGTESSQQSITWSRRALVTRSMAASLTGLALTRREVQARIESETPAIHLTGPHSSAHRSRRLSLQEGDEPSPTFVRGFVIAVGVNTDDFRERLVELLDHLVSLNVDSVRFHFDLFQESSTSSTVFSGVVNGLETPTVETMRIFYEEARRAGMRIMVAPMLNERTMRIAAGEWRGNIAPADIGAWFNSYGALLVDYARLAQEYGVESFCVGSEFSSLEPLVERWAELIGRVRDVFDGRICYAFNWPTLLTRTNLDRPELRSLINLIDDIGISPYYPLDVPSDATLDLIVIAWQQWIDEILAVRQRFDKPILFTEVGARSIEDTYITPGSFYFSENVSVAPSEADQDLYFQGLFTSAGGAVDGMYIWYANVYSLDGGTIPAERISFSPLNKLAEGTIGAFYGRSDESLRQLAATVKPSSSIAAGMVVTVAGESTNLWEFPSTRSLVIAVIEQGTQLLAVGPGEAGWVYVRDELSGLEGYASTVRVESVQ